MKLLFLIFLFAALSAASYAQRPAVKAADLIPTQIATVTGDAFLLGTPSEAGAVVDTLIRGSKVEIIKWTGDWALVQSTPFVGWIHRTALRLDQLSKTGTNLEQISASSDAKPQQDLPADPPKNEAVPDSGPPPDKVERLYIRGPRGGCYYIDPKGKKVYVAHRLCGELPHK